MSRYGAQSSKKENARLDHFFGKGQKKTPPPEKPSGDVAKIAINATTR
jgi:hypothetical protein